MLQIVASLTIVIHNHNKFILQATSASLTIVIYNHYKFILQATGRIIFHKFLAAKLKNVFQRVPIFQVVNQLGPLPINIYTSGLGLVRGFFFIRPQPSLGGNTRPGNEGPIVRNFFMDNLQMTVIS
jgi:hypothetical protein